MTGLTILGATILLAGFAGGVTAQEQATPGSPAGDVVNIRDITTKGKLDKKKAAALGLDADSIRLPRLRRTVQPVYPGDPGAIPRNTRVVAECRLETSGILRECRVVESGGSEFDVAAAAAISQWQVTPLMVGDQARPCLYTITLDFNVQYVPKF
jgi:TonB family protein